ncbi:MAG: hypothetical protein ACRDNE_13410 [Gaiellaceae bacterium]
MDDDPLAHALYVICYRLVNMLGVTRCSFRILAASKRDVIAPDEPWCPSGLVHARVASDCRDD